MLILLILLQRFLTIVFYLLICCSDWVIFTILFARSLICSASSNLLMISSSVFFISIINVFFSSNCLIFYLCWISHCIHIVFSRVQGVSLWSLLWTLYLVNCLSPFHFLFFEGLSCSFIWKASFSLLILFNSLPSLSLSLFSYILGTSGPSPILERRTMCKKWDTPWQLEPGVLSAFPFVGGTCPPAWIGLHFCGFADGRLWPLPYWPRGAVWPLWTCRIQPASFLSGEAGLGPLEMPIRAGWLSPRGMLGRPAQC